VWHVVNVYGVESHAVNVSAVVTYRRGYSFSVLEAPVQEMLDSYFAELAQSWADVDNIIVRASEIETRMLKLEGVADVTGITLDGMDKNLVLDSNAIPVRGGVSG